MDLKRKSYQGVLNIVRFNWHFYVAFFLLLILYTFIDQFLPGGLRILGRSLTLFAVFTTVVSLLISYYIYDRSDLYKFRCLPNSNHKEVLNINAGFDETSNFIKLKYPKVILSVADFFDPKKHTEISIKRARRAYPPLAGTITVESETLPFGDKQFDSTIAMLSAHEIRNDKERIKFFKELGRVTKNDGHIYVTEHLRDFNNFLAYTIGFFHFYSKSTWLKTFEEADLKITKELNSTPFITTFILQKNDTPY